MKVKQVVETKFHNFYVGWGSLEFTDLNDNKISIDVSDDQILLMAEKIGRKADEIKKERAEKEAESE